LLLNSLGAEISGYSLEPPTEPSLFKLCHINSFVNSTIADIRDFNSLSEKIEHDSHEIIIHMAAQPLVRLSYSDPLTTYQTNVIGTVNLLEAIRISKTKSTRAVVNVTTDKCYENKEWIWSYRENEPLGGYDPYSSSKACSELVTSAYRNSFFNQQEYNKHKVGIATARAGNVIGGGDWANDRLIPDFIRAILNSERILIRNPGSIRPWQYVLEPLMGYLMLSERLYTMGDSFSESWNFGPNDDDAKSVRWIVENLCNKWGNDACFEVDNKPNPHEATYLKLDCSKAREKINWTPRWNINMALDSIVEFAKSYQHKEDIRTLCYNQINRYLNFEIKDRP